MIFNGSPRNITTVWASSAVAPYITYPVPDPSQIGVANGRASFHDGFPPNCFVPIASGGAGPFGADFNGLLYQITADIQWMQAGGPPIYNGAFQTAIGGYPHGAIISSAGQPGLLYQSLIDSNLNDPDTGGPGWKLFPGSSVYLPIGGTPTEIDVTGAFAVTVPNNASVCVMSLWGSGGGGGYSSGANCAAGGSSGAWGTVTFGVTPGTTISGSVGAGGAAGTVGTPNGGNGGQTSATYTAITWIAGGGPGGAGQQPGGANSPSYAGLTGPFFTAAQGNQGGLGNSIGGTVISGFGGTAPIGGGGGSGGGGVAANGNQPGGGGGGSGAGQVAGKGGDGRAVFSFY